MSRWSGILERRRARREAETSTRRRPRRPARPLRGVMDSRDVGTQTGFPNMLG